jgi:crotonobetaine/carnitine-CoA ligase
MTEVRELWAPGELTNRQLWRWRVEHTPDRTWLWYDDREWSYSAFDLEVRRVAAGLREIGVGPGRRVLVGIGNRPECIQAHLAIGQLGGVVVPLLPGMPFEELQYPMQHSEATLLLADDQIAYVCAERREECSSIQRVVALDAETAGADDLPFSAIVADGPLEPEPVPEDHIEALSHIVYTSGSTGRPKGVMLKAGSHYHCGLGYADLYAFTADDRYFLPLTLAHALGSIAGLGIPMVTGGSLAMTERFRPSTFWKDVTRSSATVSVLFPAHLNLVLEVDDGSAPKGSTPLRFVVTHADIPEFRDRFGVELGTIWGMSETLICAGSDPGYHGELGPGYVGRPFAGGEVGIFDESFGRLGAYEYGELCLRHPQVMIGYLKDPEATAATLVDGWVRSGDRGFVDATGRAYFAGRYKAMIKRSGENVSAEEVEAALLAHPSVAECAVVAVPDRLRTEEVGAVVVQRSGTEIDPGQLRASCADQLVRWKLPRFIAVRAEPLPRLGNGKIDRVGTAALIDNATTWDAEAQAPAARRK